MWNEKGKILIKCRMLKKKCMRKVWNAEEKYYVTVWVLLNEEEI